LKGSSRQAAVAVAGSAVLTKIIEMDSALNDDDMENQIIVEAHQHISYLGRLFRHDLERDDK
jgi:type IV pilus assembly protein PilM